MLYIIGGVIVLWIIFSVFGAEGGCGCLGTIIVGFILWRLGLLGIIISVVRWIFVRVVYYGMRIYDFFDEQVFNFVLNLGSF